MVFSEHIHSYILLDNFKPLDSPWLSNVYFYLLNKWHLDFTDFLIWFNNFNHRPSMGQGTLGVDLFFVISGFLITGLLIRGGDGNLNVGRFYIHRFLKIYPSYFSLIIVTFLYLFFVNHLQFSYLKTELPFYLIFFQNGHGPLIGVLGHTWTLVVEEQFYFFYPIIAFIVFKASPSAIVRKNLLMFLAVIIIVIAPITRYHFHFENNMAMATFYHFDALALGCLLALNEKFLISIRHLKILGVMFWTIGIGLYVYLTFFFQWLGGSTTWYVYDLSGLAAMNIFLAGYLGVSTLSSIKFFQWLGRHSYGIYLWHFLILIIFFPGSDKMPPILFIVLYVFVALLAGILSTWTIEKYFLNLRKKLIP